MRVRFTNRGEAKALVETDRWIHLEDLQRYGHIFPLSLSNDRLEECGTDSLPLVLGKQRYVGNVELMLAPFNRDGPCFFPFVAHDLNPGGIESSQEALPLIELIPPPDELYVRTQRGGMQAKEELTVGLSGGS
jgi:hypothetical protein